MSVLHRSKIASIEGEILSRRSDGARTSNLIDRTSLSSAQPSPVQPSSAQPHPIVDLSISVYTHDDNLISRKGQKKTNIHVRGDANEKHQTAPNLPDPAKKSFARRSSSDLLALRTPTDIPTAEEKRTTARNGRHCGTSKTHGAAEDRVIVGVISVAIGRH